jgi:ubiquinone biosynthesis protein
MSVANPADPAKESVMFIQKIGVLGRTYRHIQRYREILRILIRYGFDDLVNTLRIEQYLDMGRDLFRGAERAKTDSLSRAERVRLVLEELGPTFIKLGQALSTRQDLLPADFIKELVKLQDEVPSFPFQEAREIVETELRGTLDTFFQHMEPVLWLPPRSDRCTAPGSRTVRTWRSRSRDRGSDALSRQTWRSFSI